MSPFSFANSLSLVDNSQMDDQQAADGFQVAVPFVIDGEAYTDRDRAMFVAGYEFCQIRIFLEDRQDDPICRPIHSENTDRLRVLCNRFQRQCTIRRLDNVWSQLDVEPK